ncbi:DUF1918 domain-containing protein [Saccharopolyspora subtropica]|uniref:DUF1918 domain-containing protein n=1 Tax=Saccharopolyspora thermophila TaxID=89367 RepID=A0A917JQ64_9PSEU|nr:DUF1918 domain-containing protein [Saccharopolyspora subtropica]
MGDKIHVHSRHVGEAEKIGEILEVRGKDGAPPYRVRFSDGHESVVYPGGDCEIKPPTPREGD